MKISESQFALIMAVFILFLMLVPFNPKMAKLQSAEEPLKWSAVELLRGQHREELSQWQLLQLAIIMTESKGNPNAVGASNDLGVYQMLECYVKEANRVSGSNYSHEDAVDIDNAIDIFNRLQSHYNPQRDMDEAIYRHNKSESYRATVLRNLEIVERMEVCRQKLIEYGK